MLSSNRRICTWLQSLDLTANRLETLEPALLALTGEPGHQQTIRLLDHPTAWHTGAPSALTAYQPCKQLGAVVVARGTLKLHCLELSRTWQWPT